MQASRAAFSRLAIEMYEHATTWNSVANAGAYIAASAQHRWSA